MKQRIIVTTLIIASLFVFGVGTAGTAAAAGLPTVHIINPQATDPAIDQALDNHYASVDTSAPTNGQLFVYLPGTGDVPANALLVQQMAAQLGYHVIGLMYVDSTQIQGLCEGQPDPSTCSYDARFEILTG
jgi:hypothetical protein